MRVTWVSRIGGRAVNEDAVGKISRNGITCVAVADGLGGHNSGEVASKTAIDSLFKSFADSPAFSREALEKYVNSANKEVFRRAGTDPMYINMSSTLAAILIKGKRAVWCNVGDSRLYRFKNSRIAEVTEDHSLAFKDFMDGRIEYDDIRRSENQCKLTNAVGSYIKDLEISDICAAEPGTSFLLCTDGWWEYVTEDDMEDTLKASSNTREWLESMLEIRESRAPRDSDNYTAAVISM